MFDVHLFSSSLTKQLSANGCLPAPSAWQEAGPFSGRRAMHCGVKEEAMWEEATCDPLSNDRAGKFFRLKLHFGHNNI